MNKNTLQEAVEYLKDGKVILLPANQLLKLLVERYTKLLKIKKRDTSKSQVCLVGDDAMLNQIVVDVPALAWDLIDESNTPLTLVLPDSKGLATNVVAEDKSVAVRMIKNGDLQQLLRRFRKTFGKYIRKYQRRTFSKNI